jgi:predicted DNA-binding transcriptional regulator AlpA
MPETGQPKPEPRLLKRADLPSKGIDFSASHLRKKIREQTFPAPIRLGEHKLVWDEAGIDKWIEERRSAPVPDFKALNAKARRKWKKKARRGARKRRKGRP